MTTSNRLLASSLSLLLCASGVSTASPAFADPSSADLATASSLYKQGIKLRNDGDAKAALEKLKAAHALVATPIIALELGRTYEQLAMLTEAWESYREVSRIPVDAKESPNTKKARAEADEAAAAVVKKIPSITIVVSGVPQGSAPIVTVDGAAIPFEALTEPRMVDPGMHVVVAKVEGGPETRAEIVLKEAETREVPMTVVAPEKPKPVEAPKVAETPKTTPNPVPAPAPTKPHHHTNVLLITGGVVAGAGLIVGASFGFLALHKTSTVKNECNPDKTCFSPASSDIDNAKTLGTISTIGFVGLGVGAIVGTIGLLTAPDDDEAAPVPDIAHVTPWIGFGSAGISGAF